MMKITPTKTQPKTVDPTGLTAEEYLRKDNEEFLKWIQMEFKHEIEQGILTIGDNKKQ